MKLPLWIVSAVIVAVRLSVRRPHDRWTWSAIGGSAAFLLGVHADVALPVAGIALAIFSVRRTTPEALPAGRIVPG